MSAAQSFLPQYVPAQIEAHQRIKAIRARQKAEMEARLRVIREAEEARKAEERRALTLAIEEAARRKELRDQVDALLAKGRAASAQLAKENVRAGYSCSPSTLRDAMERVGALYGIDPDDIRARGRTAVVATARAHTIAILAKENTNLSIASIGRSLGLDHTTVIHAIRRYNRHSGENIRGLGLPKEHYKGAYQSLFRSFSEAGA